MIKNVKQIFGILVLAVLLLSGAEAQTVADPAYANMQRAIGGIIQDAAVSRGFSTTDPRTYKTLYGMGKAAVGSAAAAGAGLLVAGTSPAWGTVLGMAVLGGAISYGVTLGLDSLVKWAFGKPDATPVTITSPGRGEAVKLMIILDGGKGPQMDDIIVNSLAGPFTVVTTATPFFYTVSYFTTTQLVNPNPSIYSGRVSWSMGGTLYYVWNTATTKTSTPCPAGTTQNGTQCVGAAGQITTENQTLTQAIAALNDGQKSQNLNAETMALLVNYLWQQAASQQGYDGLPYLANKPVTAADVAAYQRTHSSTYPTVESLTIPSGTTGLIPSTTTDGAVAPAAGEIPSTGVNPGSQGNPINLGVDPAIGTPELEAPPDGPTIMAPLTQGLSPLMNFKVQLPAGVCPVATFDFRPVWNQQVSSRAACDIYESISGKIFSTMTLAWAFLFLLIVLRA